MQIAARQSESGQSSTKFDRTHEVILKAAARLFCEKGYAASTLRDIAASAGMKAGSLYYHFNSKEEMLDAILDQGVREIYEGVAAVIQADVASSDYRSKIAAAVHAHLSLILARSEITSANIRIFGQLPAEIQDRHRPLRHAYAALWEALLTDAQEAGALRDSIEIVPLREFLLGALNWTVEWFDEDRHSVDAVASRCTDLILHGISAESP